MSKTTKEKEETHLLICIYMDDKIFSIKCYFSIEYWVKWNENFTILYEAVGFHLYPILAFNNKDL